MDLFDLVFGAIEEDVELLLRESALIPWADYWLNPRQLRGSDFLMRWSQGVWSETRLREALNQSGEFYALSYGPSGTAPEDDPRAVELYFLRLEAAGLGKLKRPDLLIFRDRERSEVESIVFEIAGFDAERSRFEEAVGELPFTSEDHPLVQRLLAKAVIAVECENSLWVARKMPFFGASLKPQKRLGGKLGLAKNAVLPTIILKDEDRRPLLDWQALRGVPIHIWHVFYDLAFAIALDEAEKLIAEGLIEPISQVFQAPGGQTTTKSIYKVYHHYAYELGEAEEAPALVPAHIIDKNGHVLPYVKFEGGSLKLNAQILTQLNKIAEERNK